MVRAGEKCSAPAAGCKLVPEVAPPGFELSELLTAAAAKAKTSSLRLLTLLLWYRSSESHQRLPMSGSAVAFDLPQRTTASQLLPPFEVFENATQSTESRWCRLQAEMVSRICQIAGTASIKTVRLVCRDWKAAVCAELTHARPRGLQVSVCSLATLQPQVYSYG